MQFSSRATLLGRYFQKPDVIYSHLFTSRGHRAPAALFAAMHLLVMPLGASASLIQTWNITGTSDPVTVCRAIYSNPPQAFCTTFSTGYIFGTIIVDTSLSSSFSYSVVDYNISLTASGGRWANFGVEMSPSHYSTASSEFTAVSPNSFSLTNNPEPPNPLSRYLLLSFVTPADQFATSIAFSAVENVFWARSFSGQLSLVPVPLPAAFVLFTTGLLGIVGLFRRGRDTKTERSLA